MESSTSGAAARPRIPDAGAFLRGAWPVAAVIGAGLFGAWLVANALLPAKAANAYAWDFRAFYDAGRAYLHLHSPYASPALANLTSEENFVYPPPVAALVAPLALLPYPVAAVLFIAASAVLFGLALRMLGIRDWRCYAAAFLSLPVQQGLKIGALSPLLAFLLAVVWRYRDRTAVAAPALALLVVSKLFLWPVALLFLFTRRVRTFGLAVAVSIVAVVASTLPLGLGVLTAFPKLLNAVSHFESGYSFSLYAAGLALGLPNLLAIALTVAVGGVLLVLAWRLRGDESRAFRILVVAALLLSPLVWAHYLAILFVPLALWQPRFTPLWLLSSWAIGDGLAFGRVVFVVTTFCVLLVLPFQAGIVDLRRVRRLSSLTLSRETAIAGLWLPAAVIILGATSAVPVVAALRPVAPASSASGTAFVRLLTHSAGMCWRVWTEHVPSSAQVEVVRTQPAAVVATGPLRSDGRLVCVHVKAAWASRLASTYKRRSADYRVVVRSSSGDVLLRGALLRRVDADSAGVRARQGT